MTEFPPPKRPRGRPPTPEGAKSRAEVQRAYRERQKAAAKVGAVPDFDPETQIVVDRADFAAMRDELHDALLKITLLEEDRARWQADCIRAEAELRRLEQHHTNSLKDLITLRQQMAETSAKRRPRRQST